MLNEIIISSIMTISPCSDGNNGRGDISKRENKVYAEIWRCPISRRIENDKVKITSDYTDAPSQYHKNLIKPIPKTSNITSRNYIFTTKREPKNIGNNRSCRYNNI